MSRVVQFAPGANVLDVGAGAGTGVMCSMLRRLPEVELTALEPSAAMLAILRAKPELANVKTINGFCDEPQDHDRFGPAQFDAIVSRQVVNGLFDPLLAFRHWHRWLPLAASQSMASTPYLLEACGFQVDVVERMTTVNALPTTRTPRYVVVARKATR